MKFNLRYKVTSAILITFIIIATLFAGIQLPFQKKRLQTVTKKAETIIHTIICRDKEEIANEIFEKRLEAIDLRFKAILKIEGIASLSVFDDKGRLLLSHGDFKDEQDLTDKEMTGADSAPIISQIHKEKVKFLKALEGIVIIGEKIGYIRIYFSLADIEQEQRLSYLIFGSLLGLIFLTMLILLNQIISKTVVSPIVSLRNAMVNIASGSFEEKVDIKTRDEIGELASTFNKMSKALSQSYSDLRKSHANIENQNKELKKLDRLKDQFLANVSHELRTPLNGIIGVTESLNSGIAGTMNATAKENLAIISTSARRLNSMVNDILDSSKIKEKHLSLAIKPICLSMLVNSVIELTKPMADQKSIALINDIQDLSVFVLADENRMIQILNNLIGNAIKFTDQGSVTITAVPEKDWIQIFISDTGIGIPQEKIKIIFNEFEQVDGSSAREYGGTGLGLSITKHLVEAHGGSIGVESKLGKGTRLFFSIPRCDKPQMDSSQSPPTDLLITKLAQAQNILDQTKSLELATEAKPFFVHQSDPSGQGDQQVNPVSGRIKILIVDDEPANLQVVKNFLSLDNIEADLSSNGYDALEKIKTRACSQNQYDMVLLDIMMPKMTGYEVACEIRNYHNHFEIPILMLTAMNQSKDVIKGFDSGANDYITKPFDQKELMARIMIHYNLGKIYKTLSKQFIEEQKKAMAASEAKSEFLANMSHEIRTPMNGVLGAAELALALELNPEAKRYLGIILSSGQSLLGIINDILDFSKIEAGKLEMEQRPFNLRRCMENTIETFLNKIQDENIEFLVDMEPGIPLYVSGDELRVRQIITNLIGNAVKFTPEKGVIVLGITCKTKTKTDATYEFYVKDTGI
ncbi:MAG: response regulator, partial [Desulfobacteraceae bacterium]|nr:response regulator [Desulfobacteraceae bacterium]